MYHVNDKLILEFYATTDLVCSAQFLLFLANVTPSYRVLPFISQVKDVIVIIVRCRCFLVVRLLRRSTPAAAAHKVIIVIFIVGYNFVLSSLHLEMTRSTNTLSSACSIAFDFGRLDRHSFATYCNLASSRTTTR